MKKLLSMLLVLTMVVTTLMGVMVTDVSAASYSCSVDETTGERTWTVTMGASGNFKQNIATGKWIIKPNVQHADGLAEYDLGKIEKISNLGKDYWHIDFNAIDYKEGSDDNTNVLAGANYIRFRTDMEDTTGTKPAESSSFTALTSAQFNAAVGGTTVDGVTTYGGVVKYTLYAYSKDKNATVFTVQLANPSSTLNSVDLNASKLYSPNGIPHKVEIYVWSDSKDTNVIGGGSTNDASTEMLYYNVLVDGVTCLTKAEYAESKKNSYNATKFFAMPFLLFNPTTKTEYNFKGSDWYISHDDNKGYELLTRENADDETFVNITVPDTGNALTLEAKTDNITGVQTHVDEVLEAAVVKAVNATDKTATLYEKHYNNPARMFTGEETNVKLVSRTTGAEVAPADATGTMDNYLFMVNGVYILPVKGEDPAPYVKINKDPFQVAEHNEIEIRMLREDYENNSIPADEPAYGGLRTGFLRYTNEPRGSFYFSSGVAYYNEAGYYNVVMPGMVERSTYASYDFEKNMTTLQFDMYVPEYTYTKSGESVKIALSGYRNDASTSNKNTRTALPGFTLLTNGKVSGKTPENSVDLVGNAWNTVAIQFDATNTPTSDNIAINVYVNGEKQLEMASITDNYGATAESYISFIEYVRLFMPSYSSVGIMNDGWYVGDFVPTATATTENTIDTASVSGVTVSVDNVNNLIAYDNSEDADYAKLIAAMEAAGYNAVYERVIDKELVDKKYSEVDGDVTINGLTVTGAAVKRWIELPATDAYITYTPDSNADGKNEYTIVATDKIESAVDNGDGTATLVALSGLQDMTVYDGVVHKADEIINMLIAEGNTAAATQNLVGFTTVNEAGKLPRIYTLQEMGTDLYTLAYDETTKVATLNYREFGGTDNIPFVMVVGAYDAKGKLLALDVSDAMAIDSANEADGVKTKTFTADFGTLDLTTVRKYKVFAFNSFAERKPIMTNCSMINPAYVAPVQ